MRRSFLKTVLPQKILDELIVPLQNEARLRSSQVFLPEEQGYTTSARNNGSRSYAVVDIQGAKTLLAQAGVGKPEVCIMFDVTDCSSTDCRQLLGTDGGDDASLYALRPSSLAVSAVSPTFGSDPRVGNDNFSANPTADALIESLNTTFDRATQLAILQKIDAWSGRIPPGCRSTSSRPSRRSTTLWPEWRRPRSRRTCCGMFGTGHRLVLDSKES